MKPLPNSSSNCLFSSAISAGASRYGARETGAVPGSNSIVRASLLAGGGPFKASNTSSNSSTTGMSCNL
uniref:Uncharacterized protein n=1 Tax=Brassica oleracea var. oleracea TaxID=109376 RepID=A0A0D3EA30_BRAOL